MTLNGAIMQLVEMRENSMMPEAFKPYFDQVIETVSECEEPSAQPDLQLANDCISRQEAIDAVSNGCWEWRGIYERCKENILALPSAQPEPSIRIITAHLKQRLWEMALNNVAIKGTLGNAYADVAKNRLDAWMNEIIGTNDAKECEVAINNDNCD